MVRHSVRVYRLRLFGREVASWEVDGEDPAELLASAIAELVDDTPPPTTPKKTPKNTPSAAGRPTTSSSILTGTPPMTGMPRGKTGSGSNRTKLTKPCTSGTGLYRNRYALRYRYPALPRYRFPGRPLA